MKLFLLRFPRLAASLNRVVSIFGRRYSVFFDEVLGLQAIPVKRLKVSGEVLYSYDNPYDPERTLKQIIARVNLWGDPDELRRKLQYIKHFSAKKDFVGVNKNANDILKTLSTDTLEADLLNYAATYWLDRSELGLTFGELETKRKLERWASLPKLRARLLLWACEDLKLKEKEAPDGRE